MSQPTSESTAVPSKPSTNPGSYEELHRKARDIFPTCFEGAKVMISKGLSSHFQVSHTLSISPTSTGYRFGATYVGTKVVGPQEQYPIFLGDTDVAGNTTATVVHQFGDNYRLRLQGQVQQNKLVGAQGTFERRGRLTTLGLTFANTDVVNESGVVVGQLLRKLTNNIDVGTELLYQYGKQIPGQKLSMLSYSLRYTTPIWTAVATLGSSGAHFTYYHKQTDNLSFGVEFESNTNVGEAVGTFAYQAELPDEGVTMRASIDTNWSVGGVFEKRLSQQLPFTFAMSGLFNHAKV
ncbi:unnamed protein product [Angiostrongylus costaricensis]|uniref:Mitochondrial import receptor subunit tom40 n=1 Tax=Angiostrongylus costaricensis TaxID=334426 RepID=A0A0R3P9N5_ANGCS|nr:unnamed protein product [Angiostrongylus costaricensis]